MTGPFGSTSLLEQNKRRDSEFSISRVAHSGATRNATTIPAPSLGIETQYSTDNVLQFLWSRVQETPDAPALYADESIVSFACLWQRAAAFAKLFEASGVEAGDRVAVMFPNHPDFPAIFFGILRLGAVVVPVNPLLKAEEICHILEDSGAKALIAHRDLEAEALLTANELIGLAHYYSIGYEQNCSSELEPNAKIRSNLNFRKLDLFSEQDLYELVDNFDPVECLSSFEIDKSSKDDLAVLVYTSGTTGKPKGAMLTNYNLVAAVEMRRTRIEVSGSDRVLAVLPLCHIFGMAIVMLGTLCDGGSLVIDKHFDANETLDLIERRRVTFIPAVPAMFNFMSMALKERSRNLSSLRFGLCGGAPVEPANLRRFDRAFGVPILEGYALTEVSCIATLNLLAGPRKSGSVGPAVSGVVLSIVDAQGNHLPPGKNYIGEVVIRGANVMSGYFNLPEATAESLKEGWFYTGDLGFLDKDGYLFLRGRSKELIIRGGQNIYPREIESVIAKMPQIADCAVIGVPDELMGERVKAFCVLKTGQSLDEETVKKHCASHLAPYKVPRLVSFIDQLPRNSTGKVLKRVLINS